MQPHIRIEGGRTTNHGADSDGELTFRQRVVRIVRLLRPANSLAAAALVVLGARLAGAIPSPERVWAAALAMWCITTFGYVSNDWFDRVEDAVNKPGRALPSGALTPATVAGLAVACALAGLAVAATLGWPALCAAAIVLALLMLYNLRLKGTAGAGNLLIAALSGSILLVGVVAAYAWQPAKFVIVLPASALLTLFVGAREITKTLQDIEGDRVAGKHTLATTWGPQRALLVVAALGGACLVAALWGMRAGYSLLYLAIIVAGVVLPILGAVIYLWRDCSPARVNLCLNVMKAGYLVGILALLVA